MNCDDKDDIIAYYNELIEDKMDKTGLTEEEVIDDLDDIDDLVRKTNVQSGVYQKIKYDEDEISKKKRKYEDNLKNCKFSEKIKIICLQRA